MGRPLDPLFSPRSIAVIGASRRPGSVGGAVLHNLVAGGFTGPVYPVNPEARSVHSLPCYRSVSALPEAPELAIIVVPAAAVPGAVEECLHRGARGLVVISAGFAETGAAGATVEAALRELVRAAGARMVGPNCMGIINTDPAMSMNATFAPATPRAGSVGFVSQSGALGIAILNVAAGLGLGLTQFASMGNKADVSGNDLLEHWEDDEATRVICMYLESFGNPRRFLDIARRVGRKKPIVVVKAGRTEAGARAASSHTGALAGTERAVAALLAQSGVLRVGSIEELFDVARALDRCPLPAGRRVGLVTNAGGPAIMAVDALVAAGLVVAPLSAACRERLARLLPAAASLGNPVDMIASAGPTEYRQVLAEVLAEPEIDLALAIHVTPRVGDPTDVLEAATAAAATAPDKPVLAVMMAEEGFYAASQQRPALLPVYRFPEAAAGALAQLCAYADWRRRAPEGPASALAADDERVERLLARRGSGYLPVAAALELMDAYRIPVARWRHVELAEQIEPAAAELGYPVVLKATGAALLHKSELGAVAVDLRDAKELAAALAAMNERLATAGVVPDGFLLQEHRRGGQEVIFGVGTDPRFGPLLLFGLGGKYVEVLDDVRVALPPLTQGDAARLVRSIRSLRLLLGVRGEAPADLAVLEDVLLRLSQLVTRHPRIEELDLNPFLAMPVAASSAALDVRVRIG
ncbi:MAG TPA: acetate--CoA ligase family protein [Thermoanaerobaculia bacterium]|jgi:acetyl coenzyme A synthetase (ADP forming)-like protein|nr:acetate--CoA ligase family protein [Thermoanaerobaculia bacterium]